MVNAKPGYFTPEKGTGTHCTGDYVGPKASLNECGKLLPIPGFDPWTDQSVASRYSAYAIPANLQFSPLCAHQTCLLLLEVQNCHNSELSKCLYLKVK